MAIKKRLFGYALLITIFLFATILLISNIFEDKRQEYINSEVQSMYNNFNEMQTFMLMSEAYGDEMACLAFKNKLRELDQSIWDLGRKIEQYKVASEEFQKNPYYYNQKTKFNENEIFYMLLMKKLKKQCDMDQVIISFFYKNSEDCKKCDDQSFVLTDINKDIDEEISIFSYDVDLNLTSIDLLIEYHNITEFPCTIVEDGKYCGMYRKDFFMEKICEESPSIQGCESYLSNEDISK